MTFEEIPIPDDIVDEARELSGNCSKQLRSYDESLMEKYFEDPNSLTEREILNALRQATIAGKVVPMMCGSAFKNKGVQAMLDMVMEILPSPLDTEAILEVNPRTEDRREKKDLVQRSHLQPLHLRLLRIHLLVVLCFTRAYSGILEAGSYVLNTRSGKKERISRIFQMHANKQNANSRVVLWRYRVHWLDLKTLRTGDTLCAEKHPIVLESMDFPDPVIGLAIEPKTQADVDKLGMALAKLAEEDPTFQVRTDEETGQTVISGMGELHLDIIVDRLRREFKVEANQGAPQVNYKESILGSLQHREVYKKQSGGRGKFADIIVSIEPGDAEKPGLDFDKCSEGR